ncbi:DUF6241 domain-containing protein [Bhargavaea ginsengi]|nr:DUF6241 domain-containing protein [Bhargavaea ginsengi]
MLTQDEFTETYEETGALDKVDGLDRVGLNGNSSEAQILEVMHQMTHQKIAANQKWGAVPMTTRNIEQLESIVSTSDKIQNDKVKKELLGFIANWERGDFSETDAEHNYIWDLQDGTLGKARGLLSKEQEQKFIKEWFLDEETAEDTAE